MKLKPAECLMIGDRPERDIKGARRLGMKTVFAKYGNHQFKGKTSADYEITSIQELVKIIEKEK